MICQVGYCDFYIWTSGSGQNDKILTTVERDDQFINTLLARLNNAFHIVILPELLTRANGPELENDSRLYCDCTRPSFGLIVACGAKSAKLSGITIPVSELDVHQRGSGCYNCKYS